MGDAWKNRIVSTGDEAPDQLLANPNNWRVHPKAQQDALAAVLDDVGWVQRVIVNRTTDHVVDGHLRVALALSRGEPTIPVSYVELDPREEALVLASLDPLAAMATTDKDKLAELLRQAEINDQTLRDALNDTAGIIEEPTPGNTDPDDVPGQRSTDIQRGDLFELGSHRLLCGDSTDADNVATVFKSNNVRLCFTSPPYAQQRDYKNPAELSVEHLSNFLPTAVSSVEYFAVNLGISRSEGVIDQYWDRYIDAAKNAGLGLLSWNIWSRENMKMSIGQSTAMFPIQHEWVFVFGTEPTKLIPIIENKYGGKSLLTTDRQQDGTLKNKGRKTTRHRRELGTITTLQAVNRNDDHPAQFPVGLPQLYLQSFGGDVFDPFCGSGTTLIAAEQLGRRCYAIEIEPSYCQVTIDRWEAFTGKTAKRVNHARKKTKTNRRQKTKRQPRTTAAQHERTRGRARTPRVSGAS